MTRGEPLGTTYHRHNFRDSSRRSFFGKRNKLVTKDSNKLLIQETHTYTHILNNRRSMKLFKLR